MSADENVVNIADFRGRKAQLFRERSNVVTAQFRKSVRDTCTIHVLREPPPTDTEPE